MPPPLTWTDLAGRRVGIWGVGVEGRAALRRLQDLDVEPVLVDDTPPAEPLEGRVVLPTASGGLQALAACDVVIKSPGISVYRAEYRQLIRAGVPVVGGLGLWLQEPPIGRVVGIVGTKGKSTTASILGALLSGLGHRCFVGGNLGLPPFDPQAPQDWDFWVIEISSFQVVSLTSGPEVVAVTSLHPDHLDWHGDVETYFADKLSICTRPGVRTVIANGDDAGLREHRHLLGDRVGWVHAPDDPPAWMQGLGLRGRHNTGNALIARSCLAALGLDTGDETLGEAARSFAPLHSRLHTVGSVGGVEFVDDSLSTNVLATVAAMECFDGRRVALLVGGKDRGIEYGELARYLGARQEPTLVLALPANGERIAGALAAEPSPALEVRTCSGLAEAVPIAHRWAQPDGVVLLSPAASSFGIYRDYRDRAGQFLEAARSLGPMVPVT